MKLRVLLLALASSGLFACEDPPPRTPVVPAGSTEAPPPPPSASAAVSVASPVDSAPKPPPPLPSLAELQLGALASASEALNAKDAARYTSLFTRNAIHKEAAGADLRGPGEMQARMGLLMRAFPDLKFQFERVWQKDSVAVATWKWTGTDSGGYIERRPTNRRAGLLGVTVGFFNADGQIREVHLYQDGVTVASQLDAGAKPGSFRAPPEDPTGARPRAVSSTSASADEEAKALAASRALYDALERRDKAALAGLVTDDLTIDDLAAPARSEKGKAAVSALVDDWSRTFGAFTELPLYNHLAVGSTVIVERVLSGKLGGKPVKLHALDLAEYKDGKLARLTVYSDTLELWHQAGPKAHR